MSLIRVLVAGTQQCGKSTLVKEWTGLRSTPMGQHTRVVFEAGTHWNRPVHIRDIPAIDFPSNEFPLEEQVRQQKPHYVILMSKVITTRLVEALSYLVRQTTIPILVLLTEMDSEKSREELSGDNRDVTNAFTTGRIDVRSNTQAHVIAREWILIRASE